MNYRKLIVAILILAFTLALPAPIRAQSVTDEVPPVPIADKALRAKEVGITVFGITLCAAPGLCLTMDSLAIALAKIAIESILDDTINWINSGFEGNPAFINDPEQYFTNIADGIAGDFINGSDLGFLCSPFQAQIRLALRQRQAQKPRFQCTLTEVVENIEGFYDNFAEGGWDGWFSLTQNDANNPYGAYLAAQIELDSRVARALGIQDKQLSWNSGFLSWSECIKKEDESGECLKRGPVKTPGIVIQNQLESVLGTGLKQLELADEVDEVIAALFAQLLKSLVFNSKEGLASDYHVAEEPKPPGPKPPGPGPGDGTKPSRFVGYNVVNGWQNIDANQLAILLKQNNLNLAMIEYVPWGSSNVGDEFGLWRDINRDKTKQFVEAMRAQGIWTFINIVNWNSEDQRNRSDAEFRAEFEWIKQNIGTNRVILQAASEWEGGKANGWAAIVATEWPGLKSWNQGSRPDSGPAGHLLDWHPCTVNDLPSGSPKDKFLVNTDCGISPGFTIYDLNYERDRIPGYVAEVLRSGSHFHYYDFLNNSVQQDVISAIGQGLRESDVIITDVPCAECGTPLPPRFVGYGVVESWQDIDAAELANHLSANGLNFTEIEYVGGATDGTSHGAINHAKTQQFVQEMRAKNIWTFINMVNWNYAFRDEITDELFRAEFDWIKNTLGTDKIILQATSEGAPTGDPKQARFIQIVEQEWPGAKSVNFMSAPSSGGSYVADWHTCGEESPGSPPPLGVPINRVIVNTDCGNPIRWLDENRDEITRYAIEALQTGAGFHYYEAVSPDPNSIQVDVIERIGEAMKNLNITL